MALAPPAARAWKPNTHIFTGEATVADALDGDGGVSIAGHEYKVDERVLEDIRTWPGYYNGGVIGPDGFPDIAYGQGIIHPLHTGRWLRYIYDQAWIAQSDTSYSSEEKQQILAFAYGFLTHAAGDMWGHTLINTFAGGVFPDFTKVLTNLTAATIAVRHLVSEGYVGSATPGYDSPDSDDSVNSSGCSPRNEAPPDTICNVGAPNQYNVELSRVCADPKSPPTPGTRCLNNGEPDISADAAPGVQLEAPLKFLQRTMIDLSARTPEDGCQGANANEPGCPEGTYTEASPEDNHGLNRGAALNFVLKEEAKLQIDAAKKRYDAENHCTTVDPDCHETTTTLTVHTVRGYASVTVTDNVCTAKFFCFVGLIEEAEDFITGLIADYEEAWISDINELRDHWGDFALGVTRGLFDPQTRRDAANHACNNKAEGPETITNNARNNCEAGIGHVDAIIYALDHLYASGDPSFINRYLIPASGLPDGIGNLRGLLQEIGDAIGGVFTYLGIQNPIAAIDADIKQFIKEKIENFVKEQYGIDPEALDRFIHNPAQWMCGTDASNPASLTLPGLGTLTPGGIFNHDEHAQLDSIMGLATEHHEESEGLPLDCSPLMDEAKFDPNTFAPVRNTITTAKLLLLNGKELNRVMGNILVDRGIIKDASSVKDYSDPAGGSPANIMIDGLGFGGATSAETTWLDLIDGDHAWRANRLPDYCEEDPSNRGHCKFPPPASGEEAVTDQTFAGYTVKPRVQISPTEFPTEKRGGNGNFPPWASCLLRPAFRAVDQNGSPVGLYADWENSQNPVKNFPNLGDPAAPDASAMSTPIQGLTVSGPEYTAPGGTEFLGKGVSFTLVAHDAVFTDAALSLNYSLSGPGFIDTTHEVPNGGTFAFPAGALDGPWVVATGASNPCHSAQSARPFTLDTTPPVTAVVQPAATTYTHSQVLTLNYSVNDGTGSGVKEFTPTLDGATTLAGHGLQSGQAINLLTELSLGPHTFTVNAVDNVSNHGSKSVTFAVIVTPQSIKEDVLIFFAAGKIKNQGIENSLLAKLDAAAGPRMAGDCATASNIYRAFQNDLSAQAGKGIDATAASIMTADASYLIQHCP